MVYCFTALTNVNNLSTKNGILSGNWATKQWSSLTEGAPTNGHFSASPAQIPTSFSSSTTWVFWKSDKIYNSLLIVRGFSKKHKKREDKKRSYDIHPSKNNTMTSNDPWPAWRRGWGDHPRYHGCIVVRRDRTSLRTTLRVLEMASRIQNFKTHAQQGGDRCLVLWPIPAGGSIVLSIGTKS